MLNELRDKFTDERSKLEKEEMTLHHAHQSLMQEHLGETHKFEKTHKITLLLSSEIQTTTLLSPNEMKEMDYWVFQPGV